MLRATADVSVRHSDKTSVSSAPCQLCTQEASSTLDTSHEKIFGLNVQLSSATLSPEEKTWSYLRTSSGHQFLLTDTALQPSAKVKELVGMAGEEGTS